jgi:hypothetical protein
MDSRERIEMAGLLAGIAYLLWYIYAICAGWWIVTGQAQ